MYRYPPNAGIGHDTNAEKVVMRDIVFAFAYGFTWSIAFTRNVGSTENAAKYLVLSDTADNTVECNDPLGENMRTVTPNNPIT